MNHLLTSFEIVGVNILIGIYPSYEEAAFIRTKVRFPNQCIISNTDKSVTTTKVGDYLRRRKIWWRYSKNQGTTERTN